MMLKIIAEIGINHNGDFRLIEELVRQASSGGADFAKFQLYDSMSLFGDQSRQKYELKYDQVKLIVEVCRAYGIEFFASVFDETRLEWCRRLGIKYVKVASRTLSNDFELTKKISTAGMKTFVSLGRWTHKELPELQGNVSYFNCLSKYPTSILDLSEESYRPYGKNVIGLSDHSLGIANCLYHITRGAEYVEKHFTLNKGMTGNDHVCSMDLEEMKTLRVLGDELFAVTRRYDSTRK